MMATPPKTPKTQTSIASERAAGRTSTGSHARTGAEHASERARASKSASATSRANTPSGAGERTSGEGQPEGGDLGTQLSGRSWASRRSSAAQRDLQNSRSSQRLSMSLVRLMSRHSEISPEQLLNNARSGLEKIADHPSDYVAPEFANVVEDRRSDASCTPPTTQQCKLYTCIDYVGVHHFLLPRQFSSNLCHVNKCTLVCIVAPSCHGKASRATELPG